MPSLNFDQLTKRIRSPPNFNRKIKMPTNIIQQKKPSVKKDKNSDSMPLTLHQFRTPLTIMNWYAEALLSEGQGRLSSQQKKYLNKVYQASQRLVELVNDFLNASKIESDNFKGKPEVINLLTIADNVFEELWPQIRDKKLKIKRYYDRTLFLVYIDPKIARMIFQNLLSNAVKYTPQKGRVQLLIRNQGGQVLIRVSDSGCGIPKDEQVKIFSKFFRATNARKEVANGLGLGLYLVKLIVEQTNGQIWFESEENKGTVFYVTLPSIGNNRSQAREERLLFWIKEGNLCQTDFKIKKF